MSRRTVLAVVFAVAACRDPAPEDPTCRIDTDGDGLVDCEDEDDDDDGLLDEDEPSFGTDPLDADTDHDGLSDALELSTTFEHNPAGSATVVEVSPDPTTPTLLVELDYMAGFPPSAGLIERSERSFEHAGIEAFFLVGDELTTETPLVSPEDMERILSQSDDRDEYVHVVLASHGEGTKHGTSHYARPNDPQLGDHGDRPAPASSGSFVFMGQIDDDYVTYQDDFEDIGISRDVLVARTLVHEIGHLVGCTHEGPGDGYDAANVMISNSRVGNPGTDPDRWALAALGEGTVGYPTFTSAAVEQMDLAHKASVERGTSAIRRAFDMGPAGSPVEPGYHRVTPQTAFDPAVGHGFEAPLPTSSSTQSSDPSDPRTADHVSGDLAVIADTSFRVAGLGAGPVTVFIRLGATVAEPREVRCEIVHPDHGVAYLEGTIEPGGDSVATRGDGVLAFPVLAPNLLGYGRGDILVECRDGGEHVDAPIELVTITKREP